MREPIESHFVDPTTKASDPRTVFAPSAFVSPRYRGFCHPLYDTVLAHASLLDAKQTASIVHSPSSHRIGRTTSFLDHLPEHDLDPPKKVAHDPIDYVSEPNLDSSASSHNELHDRSLDQVFQLQCSLFEYVIQNKPSELIQLLEFNPQISINLCHPVSKLFALHIASARGYDAIVSILLENGAIVDLGDADNEVCYSTLLYHYL
jgi:hypothetical protein